MVTLYNITYVYEWYMAKLVIKNKHQNNTHSYEIGLCAQNLDTMQGSIVKTIGRAYVTI